MAGPWERVTFVEGRLNTVYEDSVPGDLRVMYYRIAAVNRFGGESEPTEQPIRAVTKAEPLPPIGLEASASSLGRADLRWSPNVEPDLASYEVWRALANGSGFGEEVEIAQVPAGTTQLADGAIGCGESARYRLRATDADALVSLPSEPLEVKGADAGLALTRRDGGLVLVVGSGARRGMDGRAGHRSAQRASRPRGRERRRRARDRAAGARCGQPDPGHVPARRGRQRDAGVRPVPACRPLIYP